MPAQHYAVSFQLLYCTGVFIDLFELALNLRGNDRSFVVSFSNIQTKN